MKFKSLAELKTHMSEEHEDDTAGNIIKHRKLNRKNNEVVYCSSHFSEELFPDLLWNIYKLTTGKFTIYWFRSNYSEHLHTRNLQKHLQGM